MLMNDFLTFFQPWPLIVTIEDVYVPDSAPLVIDAIADLDSESCGAILDVWGINAMAQAEWEKN